MGLSRSTVKLLWSTSLLRRSLNRPSVYLMGWDTGYEAQLQIFMQLVHYLLPSSFPLFIDKSVSMANFTMSITVFIPQRTTNKVSFAWAHCSVFPSAIQTLLYYVKRRSLEHGNKFGHQRQLSSVSSSSSFSSCPLSFRYVSTCNA